MTFAPVEEQLSHIQRGTAEIISEDELRAKACPVQSIEYAANGEAGVRSQPPGFAT